MYDPEVLLYPRLAKEFGLKNNDFAPKRKCDEQELKYIVSGGHTTFDRIRHAIQKQNSRIVDTTQWSRNEYALVTMNFDTQDQRLARNGFSLRVRFALNKVGSDYQLSQYDMSIKTIMPTGSNVVLFQQTRGEWECSIDSLKPNMANMIAENADKLPALPEFFRSGAVRDDELYIESLGCTLRNVFPSYEIIQKHGRVVVPVFQHTEDVKNVFLTPYGDIVTSQDSEAEAEFLGFLGLKPHDLNEEQYERMMRKSMQLLDRVIVQADPYNIERNLISKAMRARNALEDVYGPDVKTVLSNNFNMGKRIEEASRFALSQKVTAEDISLPNLWHHIGHLRGQLAHERAPAGNPFQYQKNHS